MKAARGERLEHPGAEQDLKGVKMELSETDQAN
jgi:hypothetical protein